MKYNVIEHDKNLHTIELKTTSRTGRVPVLHISDVHFDSKYCKRDVLKRHLNIALERGALINIYGDLFDMMGAKKDPRSVKGDIRPEYNHPDYFNYVIEDAVKFLKPYAENICMVTYGNHETSITYHHESDKLKYLIWELNKDIENKIHLGAYAGYIRYKVVNHKTSICVFRQYYHHGFGGNARRSKGMLNVDLLLKQHPDADLYVFGHIHQKWAKVENITKLIDVSQAPNIQTVKKVYLQMASYKDDITNAPHGWAIQKGFDTPEIGGYFTYLNYHFGSKTLDKNITYEDFDEYI